MEILVTKKLIVILIDNVNKIKYNCEMKKLDKEVSKYKQHIVNKDCSEDYLFVMRANIEELYDNIKALNYNSVLDN